MNAESSRMPEKYKRNYLKDREARILLDQATKRLKISLERILTSKSGVELVETEFAEIFLTDGKPILVKVANNLFPTLVFSEFFAAAPKAVVDMGAVPYVCKGANVMKPGIRRFEGEFAKGDLVFIVDERYGKPLAIGEILLGKIEAEGATQGVVIRNVHFVGDRIWNFLKELGAKA
jgi:PUA domain protein